ncbi:MAG: T9SS type A sorting domain-containing protein [Flavobacteriales bacterium]|nr:T9SS type A sorting domain-containing protein [Flavobacteriales bacterium]
MIHLKQTTFVLTLLALTIASNVSWGQTLERQTFSSAGSSLGEFTIGGVFTSTLSSNNQLTQGFEQTFLSTVFIEEASAFELKIFPNPASHQLTIQSSLSNYSYQLTDLTGKIFVEGRVTKGHAELDTSSLARAPYLIAIRNSYGVVIQTIQFIKI